ncbi:MAG: hypothetical protein HUJ68_01135, partial [Clostridia bacterium]|nr:hypothetical protein [Clostridia bacterium]
MGILITYLNKYNLEEIEIVAFRKGNDGEELVITREFNHTSTSLFEEDRLTESWTNEQSERYKSEW